MFEAAEIAHKISKADYRKALPELRKALLDAQAELHARKPFAVILLISGQDGAGKSETINTLYEWMDPHYLSTLAFSEPSDEEAERPALWRYWKSLPPRGRIGIFAGSWYSTPIREHMAGTLSTLELDARAEQINRFETMLHNEGALILKFWFHLDKAAQKKRLQALEHDPRTAWRVTKKSWERLKGVDHLRRTAGHLLRMSDSPSAPWVVVDGRDDEYRSLTVGRVLLDALRARLAQTQAATTPVAPIVRLSTGGLNVLTAMNLRRHLDTARYELELAHWQGSLSRLVRHAHFMKRALVCVMEGVDAAGKGGAIRRICAALDARQYHVIPVAAPTEEERLQPYLWRFWRQLPRHGHATLFDRSWYGRVLVERIEGLCQEADWMRAYSEINDFEHEMHDSGVIVVKFWLQISQDEQLRRFKERESTAFKRFKITEEDWRNREKWDAYQQAVCDMVERTSTGNAPWTLVEANDKKHARVKILQTLCERLQNELGISPDTDPHPSNGTKHKVKRAK
ncbi:MAG: polyphosphate:AMP phosphotransferase [Hylemonella sp.]|nr:polyphosphate:AMP phosphotransferase [Hylemonella sp.]